MLNDNNDKKSIWGAGRKFGKLHVLRFFLILLDFSAQDLMAKFSLLFFPNFLPLVAYCIRIFKSE